MSDLKFDRWPEIERWYRYTYRKEKDYHPRLNFIPMEQVRQWLSLNGMDGTMPSKEASKYQPYWQGIRNEVIERQGKTCQVCSKDVSGKYEGNGVSFSKAEVDHILPIAMGGLEFDLNNLRVTCKECNTANRPSILLRENKRQNQTKLTREWREI